jgi:hypothetical protein
MFPSSVIFQVIHYGRIYQKGFRIFEGQRARPEPEEPPDGHGQKRNTESHPEIHGAAPWKMTGHTGGKSLPKKRSSGKTPGAS